MKAHHCSSHSFGVRRGRPGDWEFGEVRATAGRRPRSKSLPEYTVQRDSDTIRQEDIWTSPAVASLLAGQISDDKLIGDCYSDSSIDDEELGMPNPNHNKGFEEPMKTQPQQQQHGLVYNPPPPILVPSAGASTPAKTFAVSPLWDSPSNGFLGLPNGTPSYEAYDDDPVSTPIKSPGFGKTVLKMNWPQNGSHLMSPFARQFPDKLSGEQGFTEAFKFTTASPTSASLRHLPSSPTPPLMRPSRRSTKLPLRRAASSPSTIRGPQQTQRRASHRKSVISGSELGSESSSRRQQQQTRQGSSPRPVQTTFRTSKPGRKTASSSTKARSSHGPGASGRSESGGRPLFPSNLEERRTIRGIARDGSADIRRAHSVDGTFRRYTHHTNGSHAAASSKSSKRFSRNDMAFLL